MDKIDNSTIADYYNKNQIVYNFFYSKDVLHYGLWEKDTKDMKEAHVNTNKFIAKCLDINKNDTVLDAGCGIGGTSIFIAENYGAKVFGISISDVQLKIAKNRASESKVSDLTDFSNQDFTRTNFEDNAFSKIIGIESICHAQKKSDFLKEAYRVLKKGGRIAVCDGFAIRINLDAKEKEDYESFLKGWAVPNLATKDGFYEDMKKAGFKNIRFHDKLESIKKSSFGINRWGHLAYPFSLILSRLRFIPKNIHDNVIACINQKKVFGNIATYGVFVAEK